MASDGGSTCDHSSDSTGALTLSVIVLGACFVRVAFQLPLDIELRSHAHAGVGHGGVSDGQVGWELRIDQAI
jgi:hypothetical protein